MSDKQTTCLIVGGCYMPPMAQLLQRHDGFRRDYRIVVCHSIATPNLRPEFARLPLAETSLLIYLDPVWHDWGDSGEIFRALLDGLPDSAVRISLPVPKLHALWPHHYNDVKRADTVRGSIDDDIQWLFTYSDSSVIRMAREGMNAAEIVERYAKLDIPSVVDLERVKAHSVTRQRQMEINTDVKILDYMLEGYKAERLFNVFDHLSNRMLLHIVNQILERLDYFPLPNDVLRQLSVLNPPEIPLHPSIVRYFNLKWVTPGMRYHLSPSRLLTFEEYVYQIAAAYHPAA